VHRLQLIFKIARPGGPQAFLRLQPDQNDEPLVSTTGAHNGLQLQVNGLQLQVFIPDEILKLLTDRSLFITI